jgi:hypothetical protein
MKSITGTWQLVRTSCVALDGSPLPPPYGGEKAMGRVVLNSDGRMMAVLIDGRPELPVGTEREYMSYCGSYTFDGRQLITRVDASSETDRMGTDQIRDVHFDGDLMVLRPPLKAFGDKIGQRELHWRKISDI